ncbi:hypothetical protein SDC9_135279 [bioreactor metagenome]|uniref:Uncharacterized protein n=1 Tax=bioreactor metagenome TaxID=1076179 RepID=A0A645DGL0_9ZZZZ
MVYEGLRPRHETFRLTPPVFHYGGGADEQDGAAFAEDAQVFYEGQGLDGLAQPHVVG